MTAAICAPRIRRLRLELPPGGPEAEVVEALHHGRRRAGVERTPGTRSSMISTQQLALERLGRVGQLGEPRFLRKAQLNRIVRMIVHEALDDVVPPANA